MKERELRRLFTQMRQRLDLQLDQLDPSALYERLKFRLNQPALQRLLDRLRRFEQNPNALRLASRLDLLLLLLYAPGKTNRFAEPLLGMTRITKLLFIAFKELNFDRLVRRPYRFVPYKLGPFASEIYCDLELLLAAGLVRAVALQSDGTAILSADAQTIRSLLAFNAGIGAAERLDAGTLMFELTPQGRRIARRLYELATARHRQLASGLKIIKTQFASLPLNQLLCYVYSRYPEYTTKSQILGRLLV